MACISLHSSSLHTPSIHPLPAMENREQVKSEQEDQPVEDVLAPVSADAVESSIPTPITTEENSPTTPVEDTITTAASSVKEEDQSEELQGTQPSEQERSSSYPPRPAAPAPQLRRRPRRTGQPLHLLLQDCSKQHIYGSLSKKTSEEILAVLSDKKVLAADLRTFSNEFVLTSARDRVVDELDDEGKELLKDVDPERDIIKQRFEDESSVFKSYDDAVHDIRVDLYLDSIKPRAQEAEEETPETTARNEELNSVLRVWDTLYKRVEVEPRRAGRATQAPFPGRGARPTGPPGARPHPYAPSRPSSGSPVYGPPGAGAPAFRDHRAYRDYERGPYRDDYYGERRGDYHRGDYDRRDPRDMRGPPGPPPPGRPDMRDVRDMRDPREYRERGLPPPPAGSARYDDRRRDPARDARHAGPGVSPLASHPSLPPKPAYDASSQHAAQIANPAYAQHYPGQQPQADMQAAHAAYGAYGQAQGYPVAGQADYSAYPYAAYVQDPAAAAAAAAYAYGGPAAGAWDISAAVTHQVGAALQLQPFSSGQHGRHKAVPLPTDFMAGPSEAPRLSMPEPHEILGTIRGVIIRDAQGNIGLSQYHFSHAS